MMKRTEIIERLAQKGYTKKAASVIVEDFIDMITEALAAGEDIQFHGFGTFRVKTVKSKESIDIRSGERIFIPSHAVPRFESSVALRKCVSEGKVRD